MIPANLANDPGFYCRSKCYHAVIINAPSVKHFGLAPLGFVDAKLTLTPAPCPSFSFGY